jgi:hypothetical protein
MQVTAASHVLQLKGDGTKSKSVTTNSFTPMLPFLRTVSSRNITGLECYCRHTGHTCCSNRRQQLRPAPVHATSESSSCDAVLLPVDTLDPFPSHLAPQRRVDIMLPPGWFSSCGTIHMPVIDLNALAAAAHTPNALGVEMQLLHNMQSQAGTSAAASIIALTTPTPEAISAAARTVNAGFRWCQREVGASCHIVWHHMHLLPTQTEVLISKEIHVPRHLLLYRLQQQPYYPLPGALHARWSERHRPSHLFHWCRLGLR